MPDSKSNRRESQPLSSHRGHPLPRRAPPGDSVTLKHHQTTRDASLRASAGSGPGNTTRTTSSRRRNSSGESHDTGQSDPRKWFDQSNENPTATFDSNLMEVDPPFFQKESDSSNEDRPSRFQQLQPPPRLPVAHSSSADDYRSVIDDLTVEIQKLKEELKRYKQSGPELLQKEKLFEIKFHGLPKRKKRELETTLRDFATSLDGSPDVSSSQQRKAKHANRDQLYSNSGSTSKHASSSTGSNTRPVDSAYASMSTGANSSGTSMGRSGTGARTKSSDQMVENYLRDIPEGLYPRHMVMSDKEKKKLVVRRLEQLFTGKVGGRGFRQLMMPPPMSKESSSLAPVTTEDSLQQRTTHQPPSLVVVEPSREARILPHDQRHGRSHKISPLHEPRSASNSNGDQGESMGPIGSNGETSTSPARPIPPEQRPTRPKDLDPDRVQVPSENMEYIRHLGLVPSELLNDANSKTQTVQPDADGWVYLNLLTNLAQLHMINVTPSFVRQAVSDISTKFQLSPDGRKIRWRGGTEGTKFSSESSGDNSQRSNEEDDTDGSSREERRKRQKTGQWTGDDLQSGGSSKNHSKFGPQISTSSDSFHYKPLFVQQESYNSGSSRENTLSSFGPLEDSNNAGSRWGQSGSGVSQRRKRRHDGAIIYYSGAPFCTDLSGDPGDAHADNSSTTNMLSSEGAHPDLNKFARPAPTRSYSGSSMNYRRLGGDYPERFAEACSVEPSLTTGADDDAIEFDFQMPWTNNQQYIEVRPLEPCGLGGVLPEDHFMVVVTTARSMNDHANGPKSQLQRASTEETTDGIISRLDSMSTSSPVPQSAVAPANVRSPPIEIHYMSGRIKRLAPVALPPPAIFFPPFSTGSDSSDEDMSEDPADDSSSKELMSRRANPHQSDDYPDGVDLSSGDEDGEDPDNESDAKSMYETDS